MFARLSGSLTLMIVAAIVFSNTGCSDTEKKADPNNKGGDSQVKGKGGDGEVKGKAETPTFLTITCMEDEGCAASVKEHLVKVEGVSEVLCDLKTKTVKVVPKTGVKLSPKVLWEAAVASGEPPNKLDGPSGLFTSVPKE